jgi:hypothetical protein
MSNATYLLLYVPICWAVMIVLEACRTDDLRRILKRSAQNFGVLTLVLFGGSVLVWLVNKFA